MAKGRATAYGDYFKNNSRTPGDDDEEDGKRRFSVNITLPSENRSKEMSADEAKKAAMRRRLMNKKKAGM